MNPRLVLLGAVVVVSTWVSCGGNSVEGSVSPAGGQVCLPDGKVCIDVPLGALEAQEVIRIAPTSDVPAGALSEGYEIGSVSGRPITFLKPATVTFSLDLVRESDVPNENLLRLYTLEVINGGPDKDWQPLDNAFVDRVRNLVRGETMHLSPFVVLRSDRLADGGLPVELDGGARDGSVIIVPPFDGGRPDAGRPDAGLPDAGMPDSGTPDAGMPDAGMPDSGTPDAGMPDAGVPDSGTPDAGAPDAGTPDAGMPVDAGEPDAGSTVDAGVDAGTDDAGVDAGDPDAGLDDAGMDAG